LRLETKLRFLLDTKITSLLGSLAHLDLLLFEPQKLLSLTRADTASGFPSSRLKMKKKYAWVSHKNAWVEDTKEPPYKAVPPCFSNTLFKKFKD
jgi:hypothetical protein